MMTRPTRSTLLGLLAVVVGAGLCLGIHAGDLEPPGPPGPTMKTLPELEPRSAIYAEMLPLTITEPGSYYLAENITTTGGGITIATNNVTLDLGGFKLEGGTGDGIRAAERYNIIITNGVVEGWAGYGIYLMDGGPPLGDSSRVSGILARGNGSGGILAYSGQVTDSAAVGNGSVGIDVANGLVVRCTTLDNNTGIMANDSLVDSCIARANQGMGIYCSSYCTVRNSTASHNTTAGIFVTGGHVTGNMCLANTNTGEDGAGIYVAGSEVRVEGNHVFGNDVGISATGTDHVIIRNSASGNTYGNYDIAFGNDVGPIGNAATATSPWANVSN